MIFSKNETLTRAEYEKIQLSRLQETVRRVYQNTDYYREKMKRAGICPEDIQSLGDLKNLPFTEKSDFRENYPFGMLAVPQSEVVRIQTSSGTSGNPTVSAYTRDDVNQWVELDARIQAMGGVGREDIVQIANNYGMFAGAFGHDFGAMKIGAMVIPSSAGHSEKQLQYLRDFHVTALQATPTYVLHLNMLLKEKGIDPQSLSLNKCLMGGEGMTEPMRDLIREFWGDSLLATQNYGMCELGGTGISGECEALNGMHIQEDCFLPEIIDPQSKLPCAPGEKGELVITTLTREAMPVIRYRTRDITRLMYEPCPCGRTNVRMDKILGRTDQMMVIRGVNVFPSQIEEVILPIRALSPNYEILVYTKDYLDRLMLRVETAERAIVQDPQRNEELTRQIRCALHSALNIDMEVKLLPPGTFGEIKGKAKRIVDIRTSGNTELKV